MPQLPTQPWRCFLDSCYYAREKLATLVTFVSLHIYGSKILWNEIKKGRIESNEKPSLNLDRAQDLTLLLSEAKSQLNLAEARRTSTTDKCKALVTLSSLVLAASGLVVSRASLDSTWTQLLLLFSALALLHVVILISIHFAVGVDKMPAINQHEASLSGDDLRKSLINSYLDCQSDRDSRSNFLVELYKGARFYFLIGLSLLILLLVTVFPTKQQETQPPTVAEILSADTQFTKTLQAWIEQVGESLENNPPKQPPHEATPPTTDQSNKAVDHPIPTETREVSRESVD